MVARGAGLGILAGACAALAACRMPTEDPWLEIQTDEILEKHEGLEMIRRLEKHEPRLWEYEEVAPGVRCARGRVFIRLYREKELLLADEYQGLFKEYVSNPSGRDLLLEAGWLFQSVLSERVPTELRFQAARGLAEVFRLKVQDVTTVALRPAMERTEFHSELVEGLVALVLLRLEATLRAYACTATRSIPDDEVARAWEDLRNAVLRFSEHAKIVRRIEGLGASFRQYFARIEATAGAAAQGSQEELLNHVSAYLPGEFPTLGLGRHIEEGHIANDAARELQLTQASHVSVFEQYERALAHFVLAIEVVCQIHNDHEGLPAPQRWAELMETLSTILSICQEMVYRG